MGIQFQCDNRLFTAVFARAKVILEKQQKRLCGYEQDTGNSVYEQMEAIYQALSERNPVSQGDRKNQECRSGHTGSGQPVLASVSEREAVFAGEERIFLSASAASPEQSFPDQTGLMDLAVYYCALLVEAKLHPVLIFSEDRIAVGVWIYEDYNMGSARISTPDFSEEAYDAGGMILPVDCSCLMDAAAFSKAVEAGCRVTADFVFAEDIALENEAFEEPVVILTDTDGNQESPLNLSDDETCPYFKELLSLYDQVADQEPLAASLLSDSVRHRQWASAFFGKWEFQSRKSEMDLSKADLLKAGLLEVDFPKTGGNRRILHLPEMEEHEMLVTETIHQAPLLLVETEEKRQELITADAVLQELNQGNQVLVLASEERLEKVASLFAGRELSASVLWVDGADLNADRNASFAGRTASLAELYQFLMDRCREEEKPDDKRIDVKKRRYGEVLEKLENYNNILDRMTGCGRTLGELLEGWDSMKDCPVDITISQDREWNVEILDLVRQYADALEKCRLKDQKGEVYLDLGSLTSARKEELVELLHACETPAGTLYTAVEAFGRKIGRTRGENESARSYLQAITGCAELLEGCLSLLELQKVPEYIPEAQDSDREAKEAYDAFLARLHNRRVLNEFIDSSSLSLLAEEEFHALLEACNEVQSERSNHSLIKSRAYKVALKEMQELLEPLVKPGIVLKHLNSEAWNGICAGLMEYGEWPSEMRKSDEAIFLEMSELLGDDVFSNSYLFTYQKMLVQNLLELKKRGSISDWLVLQLGECIVSASQQMEPEPKRKKLYEDARKIISVSDRYSEAIKKVFRFLKIDYHTFLKSYENESMMSFVVTWEQLLEEEKVFDEFQKVRMLLLRNQLGSVLEQFAEKNLAPEMMYRGFEKAWYDHNLSRYMEESGFNLQDYSMNLASICKIEEQIYRNEELQLENRLLRNVKLACQKFSEELEALKREAMESENSQNGTLQPRISVEGFSERAEFLQQVFPGVLMTPETAWMLLTDTEIFFDRILICGAEEILFYKVLYPVTKGRSLSLITDQVQAAECEQSPIPSAAERARKMDFPVISGVM